MQPPKTQVGTTMVLHEDYEFELELKSKGYRLKVLLI